MMSRVNKVILGTYLLIQGTHVVTANGGMVAVAGSHIVAAAAKHHSTPVVVCAPLHTLYPAYPYDTDEFNLCVSPHSICSFENTDEMDGADLPNSVFDYVEPGFIDLFLTKYLGLM
jgi:translation initiation factor eIF-2B subunit beta